MQRVALFYDQFIERIRHGRGVTFHQGVTVLLQLLQALFARLQRRGFQPRDLARLVERWSFARNASKNIWL